MKTSVLILILLEVRLLAETNTSVEVNWNVLILILLEVRLLV